MQQILFAMLAAGLVLALWSMAKVFSEEKERAWMQEMPQDRMLWLKAEAFGALSRAIGQEEDTKPDVDKESERIWAGFRQKACADCGYRKNCDRVGRNPPQSLCQPDDRSFRGQPGGGLRKKHCRLGLLVQSWPGYDANAALLCAGTSPGTVLERKVD